MRAGPPDMRLEEREIQILTIIARTLGHLDDQLGDLVTLTQQQVDLLRRLLKEERAE